MINAEDIQFLQDSLPFYAQLNIDEQHQLKQSVLCHVLTKGEQLSENNEDCYGNALHFQRDI